MVQRTKKHRYVQFLKYLLLVMVFLASVIVYRGCLLAYSIFSMVRYP
jgi:hypothetical protein